MSSFEDEFPNVPNPQNPAVQQRLLAIRKRMFKDLSRHLPDSWLRNAGAKDRNEFLQHMVTSKTMAEIVDTVSWSVICVEHEEATRARPQKRS